MAPSGHDAALPRSAAVQAAAMSPALAALAVALLIALQPITTDLMLPALPHLAADLHAGMSATQLTMSAMILAFGLAQLVWGPVADRLGRRPVLLAGLVLYAGASVGAALAGEVAWVVAMRVLQGAGMSAAVVCGRAMVRDLFAPQQGGMVMARAFSGLGLVAIASPPVAGLLVSAWGWRAAVATMGVAALGVLAFVALRLPETLRHPDPQATRLGPLLRQIRTTLAHPGFRAWAALAACTYGTLFVFLAGSGFTLIRVLGLQPITAGAVMASMSTCYIVGTLLCRRWIARHGLVGTVQRAGAVSALAAATLLAVAWADSRSVLVVMAPIWVFAFGHGLHMPASQAGAVAPFPRSAGLASALAGFATAAVAFGVGLWLGQAMDGTVRPMLTGLGVGSAATALVAWTLVRRDGAPRPA